MFFEHVKDVPVISERYGLAFLPGPVNACLIWRKNESDEVKHIDINEFLPTITTIIKGAIANTDEDTRNDVYNTLLSQVDYINGVSVKSLNLYNVDEFIDDFSSIFKLIFESIKYNFSFFLKEKM